MSQITAFIPLAGVIVTSLINLITLGMVLADYDPNDTACVTAIVFTCLMFIVPWGGVILGKEVRDWIFIVTAVGQLVSVGYAAGESKGVVEQEGLTLTALLATQFGALVGHYMKNPKEKVQPAGDKGGAMIYQMLAGLKCIFTVIPLIMFGVQSSAGNYGADLNVVLTFEIIGYVLYLLYTLPIALFAIDTIGRGEVKCLCCMDMSGVQLYDFLKMGKPVKLVASAFALGFQSYILGHTMHEADIVSLASFIVVMVIDHYAIKYHRADYEKAVNSYISNTFGVKIGN